MLVATEDLQGLRRQVAMVDGAFDLLHAGHVAYFRAASALGVPVLCNLAPDEYVARKRGRPPILKQVDRGQVVDAIRYIAYTHLSSTTTAAVLELLEPAYYVKGADWRGRLPGEEVELCLAHGTEIVFLDTVLDSSTAILERYAQAAPTGH